MSHIIDRRKNDKKKSSVNRSRYVRRVKEQVKEAVRDIIRDGSVQETLDKSGKKIRINKKGLNKPTFGHDTEGGIKDRVHPGNKEFQQGDRPDRPRGEQGGSGKGKKGSPDGEDQDTFEFTLTREEFLDMFFEDLELPDLMKKDNASTNEYVMKRSGFSSDGNPSRLNILASMKRSKGRRIALRIPKKRQIEELQKELIILNEKLLLTSPGEEDNERISFRIAAIHEEIDILTRKMKAVPFLDDEDLRYNRWDKVIQPTTQAVMFGIMDVSASMGEWEKEMAKRFFIIMLLFLKYNYEKVDIVWIRHHTIPKEVDEDEFFHSHESGGTIVSPALELMREIIDKRYPMSQWNIFGIQITDGDNEHGDLITAGQVLETKILPMCQYFAYVEVDQQGQAGQSDLWPYYQIVNARNKNLAMSFVDDISKIFPTFRQLFEKRSMGYSKKK